MVVHRLEIASLTPEDTAEYLRLRLRRNLDRLAAAALRETARRMRKLVETPPPVSSRRTRPNATAG